MKALISVLIVDILSSCIPFLVSLTVDLHGIICCILDKKSNVPHIYIVNILF